MGDRNYGTDKGRITAAVTHSTASQPKSLLGVWPTWTFGFRDCPTSRVGPGNATGPAQGGMCGP